MEDTMLKARHNIRTLPHWACSGLLAAYFTLSPVAAAAQGLYAADPAGTVDLGSSVTLFVLASFLVIRNRRMSRLLAAMARAQW
jgi:hypothetical protein